MRFKLINKFTDFSGKEILKIGDIIEPIETDSNDELPTYNIKWSGGSMKLDYNGVKEAKQDGNILFKEIKQEKQDIELIVEEIPDNDDNLIGRWRIQLDVKTTRKKLKEIEIAVRKAINDIV
jgi:hypothetical protein